MLVLPGLWRGAGMICRNRTIQSGESGCSKRTLAGLDWEPLSSRSQLDLTGSRSSP